MNKRQNWSNFQNEIANCTTTELKLGSILQIIIKIGYFKRFEKKNHNKFGKNLFGNFIDHLRSKLINNNLKKI